MCLLWLPYVATLLFSPHMNGTSLINISFMWEKEVTIKVLNKFIVFEMRTSDVYQWDKRYVWSPDVFWTISGWKKWCFCSTTEKNPQTFNDNVEMYAWAPTCVKTFFLFRRTPHEKNRTGSISCFPSLLRTQRKNCWVKLLMLQPNKKIWTDKKKSKNTQRRRRRKKTQELLWHSFSRLKKLK